MGVKPSISVGDSFVNRQGCSYTVVDYKGALEVTIKFDDDSGYTAVHRSYNVKNGGVKNPMHPSIFGVGFFGDGTYPASTNGRSTAAYAAWFNMMIRCYCDKFQQKDPSYIGCSVHSDWHNFQNFAEWYYSHDNCNDGYQLDKDLLKIGNKVYSAVNCSLIPLEINSLIVNPNRKNKELPVGVDFYKKRGLFRARLSINSTSKEIGFFETAREAELAYINARNARISAMANKWRGKISSEAYNALLNRIKAYE